VCFIVIVVMAMLLRDLGLMSSVFMFIGGHLLSRVFGLMGYL